MTVFHNSCRDYHEITAVSFFFFLKKKGTRLKAGVRSLRFSLDFMFLFFLILFLSDLKVDTLPPSVCYWLM